MTHFGNIIRKIERPKNFLPGGWWGCMPPCCMLLCCDVWPVIAFMPGDWVSGRCCRIGFKFFPNETAVIKLFVSAWDEFWACAVFVSERKAFNVCILAVSWLRAYWSRHFTERTTVTTHWTNIIWKILSILEDKNYSKNSFYWN